MKKGPKDSHLKHFVHVAEWAAAMDSSDDCIYILDLDRRLVRANKAFYRMTGTTPETAVGKHIVEIVHPEGEVVPCPVCRAQEEKRDLVMVMEADHPDNPLKVPLEITVKIVKDEGGEPISILMTLHDLTESRKLLEEKKRLEEQLRQAQRMESIGRLAGGIAHDFNNLLTTILGYCELLLREMPKDNPYRERIETIWAAGDKARALTRQLLAFSRKQILETRPVNVNDVISSLLKILKKILGEDIEIETHFLAQKGIIEADPSQIEQVIMNLAVNARDAMPTGGRLIIETQDIHLDPDYVGFYPGCNVGPHVMICVADTGEGIDQDVIEHIFDPFFTTKEHGKGTGLGLATVHGIIKQHHGQIYVYSERGKGTTFKILIPASDKVVQQSHSDAKIVPQGSEVILVVDDEPAIRKFVKDALEPLGYTCLLAQGGQEALKILEAREGKIHLLLTDVIMPQMNGAELAERVQQYFPATKVAYMSGYSDDVISEHGVLKSGINYIPKPMTPSILAKRVREILNLKK